MKKPLVFIGAILLTHAIAAQTCNDAIPASTPDSRFIVSGDEVTDKKTGLIWQRCALGQTGNDCSGGNGENFSWAGALQAAENERISTGHSWRLPNVKELRSIVEEKCHGPAINLVIFPNTLLISHWSSSPKIHNTYSPWLVEFNRGGTNISGGTSSVRLVRTEQ